MLKNIIRKVLPLEKRNSVRYPVSKVTQCIVNSSRLSEDVSVYLCDISASGLSFFFKNPWFEVNDLIQVMLIKDKKSIHVNGPIVSQRILYPNGQEDLKLAIYRYSVQFSESLGAEWLDCFKEAP